MLNADFTATAAKSSDVGGDRLEVSGLKNA